ncbi:diguanylate cyclase [Kineococcus radiotolerans SRS30216 = ATCC BAA-149]|uniref:Diguanylate cyclase n=1 Tax=Kineococcus radiotolerans (strain ATCC BAA-149 / DSM 14245 / SRS30216) TaxID=266940 RepID=A6W538_KINRD|nr:diguanylate cyclase [Kineococcus radiotolerans SRS30216 = ATCC BAA-149]
MAVTEDGPRARRWWARPAGLVEQTRWLFWLLTLLSALLLVPAIVHSAAGATPLLFTAVVLALGCVWTHRYVTRRATLTADTTEALLLAAAVALSAPPTLALGFVFPGLWFRSVYGTGRQVLRHCTLVALGLAGGLPFWGLAPGHPGPVAAASILGCLPLAYLTSIGARHLADGLFAREQGQRRDAVLSDLGRALLAVTDRQEIMDLGERAARDLTRITPGLASALVVTTPDGVAVRLALGAWDQPPPPVLTDLVLPAQSPTGGNPQPVRSASLDLAAGRPGRWVAVPDQTREGSWLITGALERSAAEAVPAMHTAFTQVAMALVTSDAHLALRRQARTDALTGLANRTAFGEALDRAAGDPTARFSVAFVDLDDFKAVNDGRGHAAGDEVLRAVAARLRAAVREEDLCARLGGDEFAVLLRDLRGECVDALTARLAGAVVEPIPVAGGPVRVGASVGVAHRGPGEDAEQVLQHADVAMYAAKAAGRNRVRVFGA